MPHKIFLSHNHKDKPLVEAVALKLASIFGQDQVFYDSWSIKPGDGIIDQMNRGLDAPEFVFFFVSNHSLRSGMVKLEWQNALYAASNGATRIIPVRIDGSDMPAVLRQSLYIDMQTVGLEAAIAQIVSVTQGNASFTPQHDGFSNLSYTNEAQADGAVEIVIRASHLLEPKPFMTILTTNTEDEIEWNLQTGPGFNGFQQNIATFPNGTGTGTANGITFNPFYGPITPGNPMRILFKPKRKVPLILFAVFHQRTEEEWYEVPEKFSAR